MVKRPDILHCRDCGVCVEGFDHHCDIVGLCIGDANFKPFILFLAYLGLSAGTMGLSNFVFRAKNVPEDGDDLVKNQGVAISLAFLVLSIIVTCILLATTFIFLSQAISPELTDEELSYIEKQVKNNIADIYDRRSKAKNFKRICKSWFPLRWLVPC